MIRKLLLDEIKWKGLSVRGAADEIGVTEVAIIRLLDDKPVDLETLRKVSSWLNIEMATIFSTPERSEKALVEKFSILLQRNPGLYRLFEEYYDELDNCEINLLDLEEILAFLIFRTRYRKVDLSQSSLSTTP